MTGQGIAVATWPLVAALAAVALGCLATALACLRQERRSAVCQGLTATLCSAAVWCGATAALELGADQRLLGATALAAASGAAAALLLLARAVTNPAWHPAPGATWTTWGAPQVLLVVLVGTGRIALPPGVPGAAAGPPGQVEAVSWDRLVLTAVLALVLGHLLALRRAQPRYARRILTTLVIATTPTVLAAAATVPEPDLLGGADYAPLALALAGLIHADVLLRNELVSVAPPRADQVLRRMSDAVVVVDAAGRLTGTNDAGRRLVRRSGTAEGFLGRPAWEVLPPSVAAVVEAPGSTTRAVVLPSGETLEAKVDVLLDPRGRRYGAVVTCREVTRHVDDRAGLVAAVASLREERDHLEALSTRLMEELSLTQQARTRLAEDVVRDPLTGLHNRRRLEPAIAAATIQAQEAGRAVAVLVVDVDHFKAINDEHGHAVGDRVLQALARELVRSAGPGETVVRYGGEEFVVVVPNVLPFEALQRAEDVRRAVGTMRVPLRREAGEVDLGVTVSVGMSMYPEHGETARDLVTAADGALYAAKEAGRNCVVMA